MKLTKIGILGGMASGKSTVVERLKELGCGVIDADEIAHRVIDREEIIDQIRARWRINKEGWTSPTKPPIEGLVNWPQEYVLSPAFREDFPLPRKVDRRGVAKIVFDFPSERGFLEAIMWPLIDKQIHESLKLYNPKYIRNVVLDIPLLIEGGWYNLCNVVAFVDCPTHKRIQNYAVRASLAPQDAAVALGKREAVQSSLDKKKSLASFIIANHSDKEELIIETDKFFNEILEAKI